MYNPQPGNRLADLDTPTVIVDLDLMEANISRLMKHFQATKVGVRPHLKTTKSPALARKLLEAGAIGGCVSKVSEAEVMAAAGIEDLLITTEIVGSPKVARLVELVKSHPKIKVVVDSLEGATGLHEAMEKAAPGKTLDVLIELNVGQNRCGVEPGAPALALAHQIARLESLRLCGVQGYEGHLQHLPDAQEREQRCQEAMRRLSETARQLRQAGFSIEIVSTGGTGTAQICAGSEEITEVQPGSFIFMDTDYRNALGPTYANALTILATVISRPAPHRAVIDAGLKSLSTDSGMAEVKDWPELKYRPGGDEHGILEWKETAETTRPLELKIGDRVEMLPSHIDTTINLHDYYYGHRCGLLEIIWPITARGKVQ